MEKVERFVGPSNTEEPGAEDSEKSVADMARARPVRTGSALRRRLIEEVRCVMGRPRPKRPSACETRGIADGTAAMAGTKVM